jgi:hypothetical protein
LFLILAVFTTAIPLSPSFGATNENSAEHVCPPAEATRGAFAALFERALRRAGHFEEVTYDEREFRLQSAQPDGTTSYAYLFNAHTDYCKAEEDDRTAVVERYVASLFTRPDAIDAISQESLLPTVRGRAFFEFLDLMQAIDGMEPSPGRYHLTLGNDLAVGIASDGKTQVTHLFDALLTETGLSRNQALRVAMENLRRISTDSWIEVGPSLFQSDWNDDYDPSRLLLTDMIRRLPVKGHQVALAPDSNTLLVTGSKNKHTAPIGPSDNIEGRRLD